MPFQLGLKTWVRHVRAQALLDEQRVERFQAFKRSRGLK